MYRATKAETALTASCRVFSISRPQPVQDTMFVKISLLALLLAAGALAIDTSSLHGSDSSALAAAAKERLHRSLALPTSYNKQPATSDEATKELLHQSLALPTIYQDLKKSEPAGAEANAEQEEDILDEGEDISGEEEDADFTPPAHTGIPCPHHQGMWHSGFSFGDMFAPLISEAARDVFGAEQIITSQMHNIFEDIFSGPAIPHILDMIEGAAGSAAARMPAFPLAPFPIRGPRMPAGFSLSPLNPQPMFGVVISSSSPEITKDDITNDDSADSQGPTWQQQVVISSSDLSRLQQLADMFEQQLQGNEGFNRKLKSGTAVSHGRVQPADVAQVVLVAARNFRAAQAPLADK